MFRAVMFGRQRTRWYPTIEAARESALKRGWGSRDDYAGAPIFLSVGVEIEKASEPPPKSTKAAAP